MKIDARYKVREMAGEHVVIVQGRYGADMTRVVALNDTSLFLWNALVGRDFDAADASRLLTERYGVDGTTALRDAEAWIGKLREYKLLSSE